MRRSVTILFVFIMLVFRNPGFVWAKSHQAKGIVFEDVNRNGRFDSGEKGLANVLVSNQVEVVKTDKDGRYRLPLHKEETVIFVIKPAAYEVPLNDDNLPQFYYVHQPKGSPVLKYGGVEPTGKLPSSVNFPLYRTTEADTFDVVVFADPQPRDMREIDYIRDDVVAELVGSKAAFGLTLGDVMYNDLSLYDRYNSIVAQIGIPFYNVPGNHDMNFDAEDDRYSLETFKRHYGPVYYAFEYGKVSFIVLDTVEWLGKSESGRDHYQGKIGEQQMQWVKNYLRYIPPERLIVFGMHIPFYFAGNAGKHVNVVDRNDLYALVKDRPHLLALAGHLHMLEQDSLTTDSAQTGNSFPEIICAAVCGSWWSGPKDERGIPTSDQRDGTPNGYHIFHFTGNQFTQRFKAAGRGAAYQIRICAPTGKIPVERLDSLNIVANIFNADVRSVVDYQFDAAPFVKMQKTLMKDPFMERLHVNFDSTYANWIRPQPSTHIWSASLPQEIERGVHTISVRARDRYGNVFEQAVIFEVK